MRQILRNFVIQMENKPECMFLTSDGTTIQDFLETNHPSSILDVLRTDKKGHPNLNFNPEAILAITCLSYEKNIAFYNIPCEKTYIFINHQHRCVRYKCSSSSVKPKSKEYLIIRQTRDDTYEHVEITNLEADCMGSVIRSSVSPIGGDIETVSRLDHVAPNLKKTRSIQNFYQALSKLLNEVDPKYLPHKYNHQHPNEDVMGLRSYLEDLSSTNYLSIGPFHGFHASVIGQCHELSSSIRALWLYSSQVDLAGLSHHFICPIICLKYPNLLIAVVQNINKVKSTHFYAFDNLKQQSIYHNHPGHFAKLINRPSALYLYTNNTTNQYYEPGRGSNYYEDTVFGMYSHVGLHDFSRYLLMIKSEYGLNLVSKIEQATNYELRPDPSQPGSARSIVVGTFFKSHSGNLLYLDQRGVDRCAVIAIFPQKGTDQAWDACIIHHPRQDPICALSHLDTSILPHTPRRGDYSSYCIRGIDSAGCKSGFLMILYAYLASQCLSVEDLQRAIKSLSCEGGLIQKTCQWIHTVTLNQKSNHSSRNTPPNQPPCWIKQITWNEETPFSHEHSSRQDLTTPRKCPSLTKNPNSEQRIKGRPKTATSSRTGSIEEKVQWGGRDLSTKKRPAQITPPPSIPHNEKSSDNQQAQRLAGPIFTPPSPETIATNRKQSSCNVDVEIKSAGLTPSKYDRSSHTVDPTVGLLNATPPTNNNTSDVIPLVRPPHTPAQPPQQSLPVRKKAKRGHGELSSGQSRLERSMVELRRARTTTYFENLDTHTLCGSPQKPPKINAPGLENPKNMCYMNAMIQLLFGMKCTRELFLRVDFLGDAQSISNEQLSSYLHMGGSIAIALNHLFQQMNSRTSGLSATDFKSALVKHNSKFSEYDNTDQHDVHLLLGAILDSLSETFRNFNKEDFIRSWFKNTNMGKIVCTKCKHESRNDSDSNFVVAVGIKNRTDIKSCLDGDIEEVPYDCAKCEKSRMFTKTSFLLPAPVLMILLKRFNAKQEKVKDKVTVTKLLHLNAADKKSSKKYVLAAIIIHIGTDLSNGHYYTLMRKGEQWLKYDDDMPVSPIDIYDVSVQGTISENAFLVVYCFCDRYEDLIGT